VLELLTGSGDIAKALHDLGTKCPTLRKRKPRQQKYLFASFITFEAACSDMMIIERLAELFEKNSKHGTRSRTNDQWKIYKMWKKTINKRYHVMYIVEK
jgi:hypothetical protein